MSRPIDPSTDEQFLIGICAGGDYDDPDPNQNGLIRVYCPQIHGEKVGKKYKQLAFSPMVMPPNQAGATQFNGVPDRGQPLLCLKTKSSYQGDPSLIVVGTVPVNRQDGGQPGNKNLNTFFTALTENWAKELRINVPPNVKETMKDGARVREIQEKGQKHKHDLLKGIQSHGAAYPLAGMSHKQLTNVSTATQAFSNILTSSMMAALPGTSFSVANILSSLSSSVADELLSSMPKEISQGVQNMFTLMQSMEISESGGFNTMGKVDTTSYLNNAVNLLKGNQSLGEVINNMKRLQSDTSLFGLDKLGSASFDIPTAFGVIKMSLSPTGEIVNETPDAVQTAMKAFSTLMTSGAGFPSGSLTNMFGDSASVMSSMFDRLPPDKQTNAKNMMEGVIASGTDPRKKLNDLTNLVQTGRNILSFVS